MGEGPKNRQRPYTLSLQSYCEKLRGQSNGEILPSEADEIRGNFSSKTRRNYRNWYQEFSRLKAQYDSLQRYQRPLLGEDLGPLSLRELQTLEHQLKSALSLTRKKKTQVLLDEMEELKKQAPLTKPPKVLGKPILSSAPASARPSQSKAVDSEPVLEIGFHYLASTEEANPRNIPAENNFMQNWAL